MLLRDEEMQIFGKLAESFSCSLYPIYHLPKETVVRVRAVLIDIKKTTIKKTKIKKMINKRKVSVRVQ